MAHRISEQFTYPFIINSQTEDMCPQVMGKGAGASMPSPRAPPSQYLEVFTVQEFFQRLISSFSSLPGGRGAGGNESSTSIYLVCLVTTPSRGYAGTHAVSRARREDVGSPEGRGAPAGAGWCCPRAGPQLPRELVQPAGTRDSGPGV